MRKQSRGDPSLTADSAVVRDYRPEDAGAIFEVRATLTPTDAGDLMVWSEQLEDLTAAGGHIWVVAQTVRPGAGLLGYATMVAIPGLPGEYDLSGGVALPWRQRGVGGRLLARVKVDAAAMGARRLTCSVDHLDKDVARFLLDRAFRMAHEECLLERHFLHEFPGIDPSPVSRDAAVSFATYDRPGAIRLFLQLYAQSFGGLAWSQPYSEAEVAATLRQPEDLLFLEVAGRPIGYAWLDLLPGQIGRIEPLGIIHGRQAQGYGHLLLTEALHRLHQRGAQTAQIGAWRQNTAALNLYQRAGFVETAHWYYLSYDLTGPDRET